MSQVGVLGSCIFLRYSATATTSAASRTTATTGEGRVMLLSRPSTAGPATATASDKFNYHNYGELQVNAP